MQAKKTTKKTSSRGKRKDASGFIVTPNFKGKVELENLSSKYTDFLHALSDLYSAVYSADSSKFVEFFSRLNSLCRMFNDYLNQAAFVLPRLDSLIEEDKKQVDKEFEKVENESKN